MRVEVRVQNTDLGEALRGYVEHRLRFALGRFGGRVGRVMVRLSDINGPRGGVDKSCRISAEVLPSGRVMLEETDRELYTAIDRAAERIGRSFGRELERARDAKTTRSSERTVGLELRRPLQIRRRANWNEP